ncbi:hypothetical protein BDN72DRAFT_74796 [Pluteus cervinus]|uniref:Uncharacterized protein n=1 Tax=Pluteus cervinus TaxID=181527 RepID=A0ACD3AR70_9AGAR|nr:hypothetical protein BDN72DRAFT_74796 [Pluteus cervinus]
MDFFVGTLCNFNPLCCWIALGVILLSLLSLSRSPRLSLVTKLANCELAVSIDIDMRFASSSPFSSPLWNSNSETRSRVGRNRGVQHMMSVVTVI